ncbi:MAG: sugar transferase [Firmicutes bacterium]|nr:sugar transferase [Bacillota bacterium]
MHKKGFYEKFLKRPFDFILSLLALVVFSPVFIMLAILVRVMIGSPIIFKQQRPGLNEKIFNLYKFRTMTNQKDSDGQLLPDENRLTKFGKFLRSTSLDELPGLINIIKGDLSIVGPRPLLIKYLPLYNESQRKRHNVRPGLTGFAQVNGRNTITWEEKFNFDIKYVENISLLGDLSIIFKTVHKVLVREGVASKTSSTMEEFLGSNSSNEN